MSGTSVVPEGFWGSFALGVPAGRIKGWRTKIADCSGVTSSGRCPFSTIAIVFGPNRDPAVKSLAEQCTRWLRICNDAELRSGIRQAWRSIHRSVVSDAIVPFDVDLEQSCPQQESGVAHQFRRSSNLRRVDGGTLDDDHFEVAGAALSKKVVWNKVVGPVSATVAAFTQHGWKLETPELWIAPGHMFPCQAAVSFGMRLFSGRQRPYRRSGKKRREISAVAALRMALTMKSPEPSC